MTRDLEKMTNIKDVLSNLRVIKIQGVVAEIIEGRFYLYPDSDSVIIAGILALIKEKNDGKIFDEINLACIDYSILPEYIVDFLTKLETELCKIKPK